MLAKLYFGPDREDHEPNYRNSAFGVFEVQDGTLNIILKLNNAGAEVEGVSIALYALYYSAKTRRPNHPRVSDEIDRQAIIAMSGNPIRGWENILVPEGSTTAAWQSDLIIHRLPHGATGYLLVAKLLPLHGDGIDCDRPPTPPTRDPRMAVWVSDVAALQHSSC